MQLKVTHRCDMTVSTTVMLLACLEEYTQKASILTLKSQQVIHFSQRIVYLSKHNSKCYKIFRRRTSLLLTAQWCL